MDKKDAKKSKKISRSLTERGSAYFTLMWKKIKEGATQYRPINYISILDSQRRYGGSWKKLLWVPSFLKRTINNVLTLEDNYTNNLTWYINRALAFHANINIHTGSVLNILKGEILKVFGM